MKRLALILTLSFSCAHLRNPPPQPIQVESVGALSESTTHVYTAPVHETTDLTPKDLVGTDAKEKKQATQVKAEEQPEIQEKDAHGF